MICIPRSAISQLFQEDGLMHFLSAKNCDILPHIVLLHIRICACTFIVDFLRLSVDVRTPLEKKLTEMIKDELLYNNRKNKATLYFSMYIPYTQELLKTF